MNLIDKKLRDKIKNTYELSISKKDTDQTTKKPIIDSIEFIQILICNGEIICKKIIRLI